MVEKIRSLIKVSLGADPEFFFKTIRGAVVEATRFIKPNERNVIVAWSPMSAFGVNASGATLISDGIQGEFNIKAATCRANIANNFKNIFISMNKYCKDNKVKLSFDEVVTIPAKRFKKMPSYCKEFGCKPSFNVYNKGKNKVSVINVDPMEYNIRSAGGHIHIGFPETIYDYYFEELKFDFKKQKNQLIKVLDLLVGNTCVIFDSNPLNAERRKHYGKAGEYRIKDYGIEYRTLSNFWLKDYKLMSMVMQLCKFAVSIVVYKKHTELLKLVPKGDIIKAINANDVVLARKNFNKIKKYMEKTLTCSNNYFGVGFKKAFYKYINNPEQLYKDIKIYNISDEKIVEKWIKMPEGHGHGFDQFLWNRGQE